MTRSLILLLLMLFMSTISCAQEVKMFSADQAVFFDEIKGVVQEEGKVTVAFCPPSDNRESKYKNLNIKEGDLILFVNGKKIVSIDDFKEHYKKIGKGENVQLGVERDGQKFIVEFKRGDEFGGMMKMNRGDAASMQKSNIKMKNGKLYLNGKEVPADSVKGKLMFKSEKDK